MQLGEVDSYVGQFQQVLDFFTVWVLDWNLWIKSSEDNLLTKRNIIHFYKRVKYVMIRIHLISKLTV